VQKWHFRHKTNDVYETKRSGAKVTTECLSKLMYGLSTSDKSGDLRWTLTYFSEEQNFSTTDISHTFCWSRTKFGNFGGLANRNLFLEFREVLSCGPVIPCGDMHQSFTGTLVKWVFFDNFPMFADSFSVLSIHCVAWCIRRKLSVQVPCIVPWFPATARPSCCI